MQKRLLTLLSPAVLIVCLTVSARASIASDRKVSNQTKATADLVGFANKYKATVEALIPIYQRELSSARETLETRKGLLEKGLVSKRDVEQSEQAVAEATRKIDETKRQLAESDQLIASTKAAGQPYWGPGDIRYEPMNNMIKVQKDAGAISGEVDWSKLVDERFLPDDLKAKK